MRSFLLFLTLTVCLTSAAQDSIANAAAGDSAYASKNYVEATRIYEEALKASPSADTYYNLGNTYFRLNEIPKAILNYRRALRINPADEDARHNLELCETKLTDRFDTPEEMFFITWTKQTIHGHSSAVWGTWAFVTLALFFILLGLYLFSGRIGLRKAGFFSALLCLVLTVVFHSFAYTRQQAEQSKDEIVLMKDIPVHTSPSTSSKKVRQLHEGTTLIVTDRFTKGWYQIEMPDGNQGWIQQGGAESV